MFSLSHLPVLLEAILSQPRFIFLQMTTPILIRVYTLMKPRVSQDLFTSPCGKLTYYKLPGISSLVQIIILYKSIRLILMGQLEQGLQQSVRLVTSHTSNSTLTIATP
jgi:hypothetical protein